MAFTNTYTQWRDATYDRGEMDCSCDQCGYEGNEARAIRSRPTFNASVTYHCPNPACRAIVG